MSNARTVEALEARGVRLVKIDLQRIGANLGQSCCKINVMGAVVNRLGSTVSAIVLFLAVDSHAGQYQLKPATTSPPFKNPDGGHIQYTNATLPYVGSSSAWGQSHQNDLNFVDCRGTITTVGCRQPRSSSKLLGGSWSVTSQSAPTSPSAAEDFDHPEWTRFSPSPFGFIGVP